MERRASGAASVVIEPQEWGDFFAYALLLALNEYCRQSLRLNLA